MSDFRAEFKIFKSPLNDVLVRRAALSEGVQLVHLLNVAPEVRELVRDLEVEEELAGEAHVLQLRHQLRVETAQGVACNNKAMFVWFKDSRYLIGCSGWSIRLYTMKLRVAF